MYSECGKASYGFTRPGQRRQYQCFRYLSSDLQHPAVKREPCIEIADSTNAFKKLDFACCGYDRVRDWNSFASSSKIFSLLKCLKLKLAPSYFANEIDFCYRLSLLFELVTAFTSSLWSGGICCCLIIPRHRCFIIAPSYLFLQLLSTTREYEG